MEKVISKSKTIQVTGIEVFVNEINKFSFTDVININKMVSTKFTTLVSNIDNDLRQFLEFPKIICG